MSKRKRDPMFAASEKIALIELVEKYFHIVESKKTDAYSIRNKNYQWGKIALEFNAISSIHPRDWTVLKNCWENLKKRAKQEQTLRNQHFMGTGGGPPKKRLGDLATERVLDLIQTRVSGFVNCFDSDGTHILDTASTSAGTSTAQELAAQPTEYETNVSGSQSRIEVESFETTCTETPTTFTVDWSQYTPAMLRENKSQALIPPQSPSPSPDVQHKASVSSIDTQEGQVTITLPRVAPRQSGTSRRRPILRHERDTQSLNSERLNMIIKTKTHAEEEHQIQMNILHLQERREEEILKQEILKTEQEKIKLKILEFQLKKLND